jgi:hypothetical protein
MIVTMLREITATWCADSALHVQVPDSINYASSLSVIIFTIKKVYLEELRKPEILIFFRIRRMATLLNTSGL